MPCQRYAAVGEMVEYPDARSPPLFGVIPLAIYCRVAPFGFQAGSAPF